jgi:cell division protein FtsL
MTRLNLLLLIALLFSSVYLVRVSHESRTLFAELDKAQGEERLLDSEFERLRSEKQSQATPLRVEKAARERLKMVPASPAVTEYVMVERAASGAPTAPAAVVPPGAAR